MAKANGFASVTWQKDCPAGSNERRLYDALSARTGIKKIPYSSAFTVWMQLMHYLKTSDNIFAALERSETCCGYVVELDVEWRGDKGEIEYIVVKITKEDEV